MPASGQRAMQVVIQQPPGSLVQYGWVFRGGQGTGMLAEQVVQLEAARPGLGDQMLVIELIKMAPRGGQAYASKRRGGVGINARPRDEAELAEQALLARI